MDQGINRICLFYNMDIKDVHIFVFGTPRGYFIHNTRIFVRKDKNKIAITGGGGGSHLSIKFQKIPDKPLFMSSFHIQSRHNKIFYNSFK